MNVVEITANMIELLASTGLGVVMGVPLGFLLAQSRMWRR